MNALEASGTNQQEAGHVRHRVVEGAVDSDLWPIERCHRVAYESERHLERRHAEKPPPPVGVPYNSCAIRQT
jgi:hypothetical protein